MQLGCMFGIVKNSGASHDIITNNVTIDSYSKPNKAKGKMRMVLPVRLAGPSLGPKLRPRKRSVQLNGEINSSTLFNFDTSSCY